jgi:hypothetical protein
MSTQMVKKITIGAEARDIAAKYDLNGDEIIVSEYAKQADMNTYFVKKVNLKKINGYEIFSDQENQEIQLDAEITKKATWVAGVSSYNATIGDDNHFKFIIVDSTVSDSNATGTFCVNNTEESLAYGFWQPGASFEVFYNKVICTNNLGNTYIIKSPQINLGVLTMDVGEATVDMIVFQEQINLTGFDQVEEEEEGGEE